jgi:AraC-like DNA-binding protein
MAQIDRLSALMSRFELTVTPCTRSDANFWILSSGESNEPTSLEMHLESTPRLVPNARVLSCAKVTWGGQDNPLLSSLPIEVRHSLSDDPDMKTIATLFVAEMKASRCGVASVLNRLGEVLIVRLMRAQIEAGAMQNGLLAALADPRLSRAIVAMHDRPDEPWRLESLAEEAGLSASRFAELFRQRVGQTPLAYLRHWRLTLAKQDIERGTRIQQVASKYCYGSSEALSRAFSAHFGYAPRNLRDKKIVTA